MDFFNAYFLSSPASIVVALSAAVFLFNEAWPRLSRQKTTYKLPNEPLAKSGPGSGLSVIKEPEVPEGWLTGRDVFELERRALFSKVSLAPCQLNRNLTNKRLAVLVVSCPSHTAHEARCISVI